MVFRRRAVMINTVNGQPVDPSWLPTLALDELPRANALMARNQLSFVWQWVPSTFELQGSVVLTSS